MFRLIRTIILVMFAFVAGILFERSKAEENCRNVGGLWIYDICIGME
ncbi:hypothetical protein [Yoonia sp. BS5-3]|uniref:Uncharacterized protein n=1 Tax=Yoonia phaeophyticola TaxID=3137369 RepID=A0ABZ2V6G5_9RHOB